MESAVDALAEARHPHPEQLAEALERARDFFAKYLHAPDHVFDVLAAFVAYSRCWTQFETAVYIMVTSPTKRCGKTRLRELVELLVGDAALSAGSVTGPALVRAIEKWKPVVIFDEADAIHGLGEDGAALLRAILNEGFRKNGKVIRCSGRDHEPTVFSAFCPKLLIGIGEFLAPTVRDRCIKIALQRKPPQAAVQRFRLAVARVEASAVADSLALFSAVLPSSVEPLATGNDRYSDAAEPLLAVAAAAGPQWEARVRRALIALEEPDAEPPLAEATLFAVAEIVIDRGVEAIASNELCAALNSITDGPWQDLRRGQGLNPHTLARILKPFDLVPRTVRFADGKTAKGYPAHLILSAARNYGFENVTTSQTNSHGHFPSDGWPPTRSEPSRGKANGDRHCDDVTVENRENQQTSLPSSGVGQPSPAKPMPPAADSQGSLFDEAEVELVI